MLVLHLGSTEALDESNNTFIRVGGTRVELEHSLVSLSKWESLYEKPFLAQEARSTDETLGYIRAMALDPDLPPEIFNRVTDADVLAVSDYIDAKMTATWFNDRPGPTAQNREVITAEIIYYWLISLNIPFECQHWHLNRLLTLVKVCNQKNSPPKKMSRRDVAERNRSLNAERKAKLGTSG